jgi:hypothetical protein
MSCYYSFADPGSKVAQDYGAALLVADNDELRRLVASGAAFTAVAKNPSLAAQHVIRSCPQSQEQGGQVRREVVLIGGGLKEAVYGIDTIIIKEGSQWRVKYAEMSRDTSGNPLLYLRNCNVDLTGTSIHYGGDQPGQMFIPTIQAGPEGL